MARVTDINMKVIIILLICTILVTIVSTWLTLSALTSANSLGHVQQSDDATVSLTIVEPPNATETTIQGG